MYISIFSITAFFLIFIQSSVAEELSFNYVFDYVSIVELKTGEGEYSSLVNYTGKVETSPYILTDNQELVWLKLNIDKCDGLKVGKSVVGLVVRNKGLVERIVVPIKTDNGMLNLLKGVVNLMNIDEMRRNKTEADVNGECEVIYESVSGELLTKEKVACSKMTFRSSIPETFDSFSIHQDSKIKIHYQYSKEGALIAVNSLETHLLESVLSEELSQTYRCSTSLFFNEIIRSTSLISRTNLANGIKEVFGEKHIDVFVVAVAEININEDVSDTFLVQYREIILSFNEDRRARSTMKLTKLLRRINNRTTIKMLDSDNDSPEITEMLHDSLISCGTKICSERLIETLDRYLLVDSVEATRVLLIMQHVERPSEFLITALWGSLSNMTEEVYDQAIQTLASMVRHVRAVEHISKLVQTILAHIDSKFSSCVDEHCMQVHLAAARNTRQLQFHQSLTLLLAKSGNHSQAVLASIFSTLCSLDYHDEMRVDIQRMLLEVIRREINFYSDPRVKYEAIFCLVRLSSATEDIIDILNQLPVGDDHLHVFLAQKLRELITMGVIDNGTQMIDSAFFRRQIHRPLTYVGESSMLMQQLMSTKSLYSDIHFNIIGDNGGIVRNSMTDIFLVSTAHENHLFTLATHISGLQSMTGSVAGSSGEPVEGLLHLVLFGKEARPVTLFKGSSQLMSTLWYAPSSLKSVLKGTFFPIDVYREIALQNGVIIVLDYSGSLHLDFSFKLSTSLWYKTADSLLKVNGNAFIKMDTRVKSLSGLVRHEQNLSIKSGLDFTTNVDFSVDPVKNCLTVSRPLSHINFTNVANRLVPRTRDVTLMEIQGSSYSLSRMVNSVCNSF